MFMRFIFNYRTLNFVYKSKLELGAFKEKQILYKTF